MQVLTFEMRRNKKIFLGILGFSILVYLLLFRKTRTLRRPGYNIRGYPIETHGRPVSQFKQNLTNDKNFRSTFLEHDFHLTFSMGVIDMYLRGLEPRARFDTRPELLKTQKIDFNPNVDTIVYLHIQKAGGTKFNEHLMKDLILEKPCNCTKEMITNPCPCKTKTGHIWLFSWFSVGWPCGLHADWTMLHECVEEVLNKEEGINPNRRFFYITLLRDPVARYLSEWKHHRVGNHWKDTKLYCNGKNVNFFDVRPCFNERTWEEVTLDEFMDCQDNLATNRQTRMLADLRESNCYDRRVVKPRERTNLILKSAKENIEHMAFYGLTEYQEETRKLFEYTFNLKFRKSFLTLNDEESDELVTSQQYSRIMKYIEADVHLYQYAKQIFLERVRRIPSR